MVRQRVVVVVGGHLGQLVGVGEGTEPVVRESLRRMGTWPRLCAVRAVVRAAAGAVQLLLLLLLLLRLLLVLVLLVDYLLMLLLLM